jgi:hypothetical protein
MRKYKDTLRDVFFYFSQPTGRAATPLCGEELDRTCERSKASQRPGDGYIIIATDTSRAILGRRCAVTHAEKHAKSGEVVRWECVVLAHVAASRRPTVALEVPVAMLISISRPLANFTPLTNPV